MKSDATMRVLIVEPGKAPREAVMEHTLEAMQATVGGPIRAVYPFEEPVALICNDESKSLGLPWNRMLRDSSGEIYDIIAGTFFLCAAPKDSESFEGLTENQVQVYSKRFAHPEYFLRTSQGLMVLVL